MQGDPQAAQAETAALRKQIEEKQKRNEDLEKMLKKCKEKMKLDAQKVSSNDMFIYVNLQLFN